MSVHANLGLSPRLGQTCPPANFGLLQPTPKGMRAWLNLCGPSGSQPLCALFLQIEGTQKLLNKDLAELINKMRLAQQNAVTSLSEECKRQMLTASHTLAVDAKNLLDAVDQAKVLANLAHPPAE